MQVIAQLPGQVTLLLFFDGLFVDHAHTPYWNKLYCDSDYPIFSSTLDLDLHLRVDHPSALRCPYLETAWQVTSRSKGVSTALERSARCRGICKRGR